MTSLLTAFYFPCKH